MAKIKIFFILLLLVFSYFVFPNTVYAGCPCDEIQEYENEYGRLMVYPKTSYNILYQKQFWNITMYNSVKIDLAFRFNYSLTTGGLYYWKNNTNEYIKLNVEHIEYNGYHYYIYWDFDAIAGKNYSGYWYYNTPIGVKGKWDLFVKRSVDPIGTWRIHLDPYYDSDYSTRVDLWVNHSQVDKNLKNFPVRVNINGNGHMYFFTQPDLDDVIFVNTENNTVLNYELENYSKSNNKLYANYWVNITDVSASVNTHFNMYYNNSGATNQANPSGVWDSDYVMVHHLTGSDYPYIDDSTSYNNDANNDNGNPAYNTEGIVGKCIDFESTTGDYVIIPDSDVLSFTDGGNNDKPFTVELIANLETFQTSGIVCKYDDGGGEYIVQVNTGNTIRLYIRDSVRNSAIHRYFSQSVATNVWYYLAYSYNGGETGNDIFPYVNGTHDNGTLFTGVLYEGVVASNDVFTIGTQGLGTSDFDGKIDEIRMSKIDRNETWLITSYNSIINGTSDNSNPFIIWGNTTDYIFPPTLLISDIFPSNNSYWCNYIINLTNLSVTVACPYGTSFNVNITFLNVSYIWTTVYNNTFNVSLIGKIPIGTTNYSWHVNATSNFCSEVGGYCYYDNTFYFNVCWEALIYMQNEGGEEMIEFDATQFSLVIEIIMFVVFMWIGFSIEANYEHGSNKKVWKIIPLSYGLFQMFASVSLMGMGATLSAYLNNYFAGFIVTAGLILLLYSTVKAFYQESL